MGSHGTRGQENVKTRKRFRCSRDVKRTHSIQSNTVKIFDIDVSDFLSPVKSRRSCRPRDTFFLAFIFVALCGVLLFLTLSRMKTASWFLGLCLVLYVETTFAFVPSTVVTSMPQNLVSKPPSRVTFSSSIVRKSPSALDAVGGIVQGIGRRLASSNPIVIVTAAVLTIVGERIIFKERRYELQVANQLLSSKISSPSSPPHKKSLVIQPRDDLVDKLRQALSEKSCALVIGSQGSGKMTVIRQALEGQEGVVEVNLSTNAYNYEDIVLQAIGILPGMPLKGALTRIAKKGIDKPTVFLRLDSKPSNGQLEQLLLWIQTYSKLLNFIIHVPNSRSADVIDLDCEKFGTKIVDVDSQLTQCQALASLRDVVRSNDEAAEFVGKVGLRPCDLSELATVMSSAGPNSEGRAERLESFVEEKRERVRFIVRQMTRHPRFANMSDEARKLFTQMSTGQAVTFSQVRSAMGMTDSIEFFGIDQYAPYVFRVNPDNDELSFSSALARVTFLKEVQIAA